MGVYPELDQLSLEALIERWYQPAPDGEDYAASYYDELASKIVGCGKVGIEFLAQSIDGADASRLGAILRFVPFKHPALETRLMALLQDDRPYVVANAVDRLQVDEAQEAFEAVLSLQKHSDPYVRGSVLRFMSQLYPDTAPSLLIQSLADPHYIVRMNAVDELDELGWTEAIENIRPLLADESSQVRQAAETAVKNLESHMVLR